MISGKEALIALANGEEVQASVNGFDWREPTEFGLVYFLNDDAKFRLKPQTITINGIEVPKPDYIVDTPHDYDGYWEINIGGTYYLFRTEQNYKQVVEALRSVFKP